MSIPESQLVTWSSQGSVTQSSTTYNTIKNVLEATDAPYANKNYKVFLQGSYGNNTNIYAESDVDIVIRLDDCFQYDLVRLTEEQKNGFRATHLNAVYTHVDFKRDVLKVLKAKYGNDVNPGEKAVNITATGNRRKADVIVAIQYRRYYKFNGISDQSYQEGICFYNASGKQIVNYPALHSKNMTARHQSTDEWLKPMVRVFKNLREKLADKNMIASGVAPSYYLEGLLYNVPPDKFTSSHGDCFVNCITWIQKADKSKFVCANEQYYLLREDSSVSWHPSKCDEFLEAAVKLWNQW